MAGVIRTSIDSISEEAYHCRMTSEKLLDIIADLDQTIAFLSSGWQGESTESRLQSIEEGKQRVYRLASEINELSETLLSVRDAYFDLEASIFDKLNE